MHAGTLGAPDDGTAVSADRYRAAARDAAGFLPGPPVLPTVVRDSDAARVGIAVALDVADANHDARTELGEIDTRGIAHERALVHPIGNPRQIVMTKTADIS